MSLVPLLPRWGLLIERRQSRGVLSLSRRTTRRLTSLRFSGGLRSSTGIQTRRFLSLTTAVLTVRRGLSGNSLPKRTDAFICLGESGGGALGTLTCAESPTRWMFSVPTSWCRWMPTSRATPLTLKGFSGVSPMELTWPSGAATSLGVPLMSAGTWDGGCYRGGGTGWPGGSAGCSGAGIRVPG